MNLTYREFNLISKDKHRTGGIIFSSRLNAERINLLGFSRNSTKSTQLFSKIKRSKYVETSLLDNIAEFRDITRKQ